MTDLVCCFLPHTFFLPSGLFSLTVTYVTNKKRERTDPRQFVLSLIPRIYYIRCLTRIYVLLSTAIIL